MCVGSLILGSLGMCVLSLHGDPEWLSGDPSCRSITEQSVFYYTGMG